MKINITLLLSLLCCVSLCAQTPYINPKYKLDIPVGKKLVFNPAMSDEFDTGTEVGGKIMPDQRKWYTLNWRGSGRNKTYIWTGRYPGLFSDDAISINDGKLKITASAKKEVREGKIWTHQGGIVRSAATGLYGYYECKMKANKTFMSSTFWLNSKCNGERSTELDIQETVGANTRTDKWVENKNMKSMNFNTHHWLTCERNNDTDFAEGGSTYIEDKTNTSDGYHIYAAFWKSKDEVIFYLDGKEVKRIKPRSDFNLDMFMCMVVETYNWSKPHPGKDGMHLSKADRTTNYEYVRAWTLTKTDTDEATKDGFTGNGLYHINFVKSGKRLCLPSWNKFKVVGVVPDTYDDQKWYITKLNEHQYLLTNKGVGHHLAMSKTSNIVIGETDAEARKAKWLLDQITRMNGKKVYRLKPVAKNWVAITGSNQNIDLSYIGSKGLVKEEQLLSLSKINNNKPVHLTKPITVFPNPAGRQINITGLTPDKTIIIRSIKGTFALKFNSRGVSQKVDITSLKPDIYIVYMNNKPLTKFIKK